MGFQAQSADVEGDRTVARAIDHDKPETGELEGPCLDGRGAVSRSHCQNQQQWWPPTSGMLRSSAIWQSGSTLISPQEKASRRSFETRFSRKSGTRLTASIKESRPPASRQGDHLGRPDSDSEHGR